MLLLWRFDSIIIIIIILYYNIWLKVGRVTTPAKSRITNSAGSVVAPPVGRI